MVVSAIHLHIVAPEEKRDKVFYEMRRPVFSMLESGPLVRKCTFISYENVELMRNLEHLAHMTERIVEEYNEPAELI
jgi:hypothetical protein